MEFSKENILNCYNLLKDCFRFEVLEEKEYICDNISLIRNCKYHIPQLTFKKIEGFIEENIYPILFDDDYFSFFKCSELGSYDENGIFCFHSDEAFEEAIRLRKLRILQLNEKLDVFAIEHLLFDIPQQKN